LLSINTRTVQCFLKRNRERGSVENYHRSGMPRFLIPRSRSDRRLERTLKSNSSFPLTDILVIKFVMYFEYQHRSIDIENVR